MEHGSGFAEILTARTGGRVKDRITAVRAEDPPDLHSFAGTSNVTGTPWSRACPADGTPSR